MGETIPHDDNYDIPVFDLEFVNIELVHKKSNNDTCFIDVQYA